MAGPTPLAVSYRITFKYTVNTFTHKCQNYCSVVASADASGFDVVVRSGYVNVGVSTLEAQFFTMLAPFFKPTDTTFDSMELWQLVGTTWVLIYSKAATVTPSGANTYGPAQQFCLSGKSTDNKNFPAYFYEMNAGIAAKVTSYAAASAVAQAAINYFFNAGGGAINKDAVAWRRSRGNFFSQRWLAEIVDTNEKLRRMRRIK